MKKIMKITLVAAFITIAGYGVYTNQKSESMSDLALSNVEALAKPEIWIAFCIDAPYVCNGQGIEDIDGKLNMKDIFIHTVIGKFGRILI